MLELSHLEKYRENNRIEAKKALGGLPVSIWETYSAFANTIGGIILLGVEELADKSLHALDLPDPERLIKEFWDIINNTQRISANILSSQNVSIENVHGNQIIVIQVPRADRRDKPVYVGLNPIDGTYRRNGEGDYHCTKGEVQAMIRDAAVRTQDMLVLEDMDYSVFDPESIRRYRTRMQNIRPGHVWLSLENEEFLYRIGAMGRGAEGHMHPTSAGLLMFGFEYEIVKEYPYYFLDYQEHLDDSVRWTDRIISSSGDWSGNIFDFFFRIYSKLVQSVKVPFHLKHGLTRIDDTSVHQAIREALANCLINADYYGRRGILVSRSRNQIRIENPGILRIDLEEAISGGVSDPRNAALIKMFNLINVGERAGSGIPNIFYVWEEMKWPSPSLEEVFPAERTILTLELENTGDKDWDAGGKAQIAGGKDRGAGGKAQIAGGKDQSADGKAQIAGDNFDIPGDNMIDAGKKERMLADLGDEESDKLGAISIKIIYPGDTVYERQKAALIDYATDNVTLTTKQAAQILDVSFSRARAILSKLVAEKIMVAEGANRNRVYKLRAGAV